MRNAGLLLSLSWRWSLALMLLLAAGTLLQQQLQFLNYFSDTRLHPSVFWCSMAVLNCLALMLHRPGLMALLWGKRLLTPERWSRVSLATSGFFLALAILALMVGKLASGSLWGYFKLYVQPLILLMWPVFLSSVAIE